MRVFYFQLFSEVTGIPIKPVTLFKYWPPANVNE